MHNSSIMWILILFPLSVIHPCSKRIHFFKILFQSNHWRKYQLSMKQYRSKRRKGCPDFTKVLTEDVYNKFQGRWKQSKDTIHIDIFLKKVCFYCYSNWTFATTFPFVSSYRVSFFYIAKVSKFFLLQKFTNLFFHLDSFFVFVGFFFKLI